MGGIVSGPCAEVPLPCVVGTKYSDTSSCFYYYECTEATLVERKQCPAPTLVFDITSMQCVQPYPEFDCDYRCPGPDGCVRPEFCTDGEILPNPDDCSTYFYCFYGQWGIFYCSNDDRFDKDDLYCMANANCHPECPTQPEATTIDPTVELTPAGHYAILRT